MRGQRQRHHAPMPAKALVLPGLLKQRVGHGTGEGDHAATVRAARHVEGEEVFHAATTTASTVNTAAIRSALNEYGRS